MILHPYETGPLCEGWTCTFCGAPLEPDSTHYVNPVDPDGAFCRPACAESYALREARKATSAPGQLGLALP
jgi:hypothetical protein